MGEKHTYCRTDLGSGYPMACPALHCEEAEKISEPGAVLWINRHNPKWDGKLSWTRMTPQSVIGNIMVRIRDLASSRMSFFYKKKKSLSLTEGQGEHSAPCNLFRWITDKGLLRLHYTPSFLKQVVLCEAATLCSSLSLLFRARGT